MWESVSAIANFEVDPDVNVDVVQRILFVDELLVDVGQHDADVLWSVEWGLEVKVLMSKVTNFAPFLERTLLRMSVIRSSDAVLVLTLPGYVMFLPAMVMRVRSGLAFSGLTLHTAFEKATPFLRSGGMSL